MAEKEHLERLKEGIYLWNRWREDNPDIQPDLSDANLVKADLVEANFSKAAITGANFAEANLRGANFSNLAPNLTSGSLRSVYILSSFLILMGVLSGLLAGAAGFSLMKYFAVDLILEGNIVFFALVASYATFLVRGLTRGSLSLVILLCLISVFRCGIIASEVFIYAFAGVFIIAFDAAISGRTQRQTFFNRILLWLSGIYLLYIHVIELTFVGISKKYLLLGIPIGIIIILINFYIAYKVLNQENLGLHLKTIGLSFSSFGAIDFRQANLTDANFNGAILSHVNLGNAILDGACFYDVEGLERARLDGTILADTSVQQLLVSRGKGERKNYRGKSLQGAYLVEASLNGADLSEADLSGANLSMANLSRANLSRSNLSNANFKGANLSGTVLVATQALGTNFSEATFTGACLEDWSINSTTQINDVICDYIYLRQDQQERRPSDINKNFALGEFTKLFQKAQETVDLIFADGIDWKAFLLSFEELKTKYGEENLSVQAIEKKTGGTFVIRLEVPPQVNKADIERQAKQFYKNKLKILENKYRTELKAKDDQIIMYHQQNASLMEIMKFLAYKSPQTETNTSAVKTILILASNPRTTSTLRLDEEVREIDAGLQRAKKRELFDLKQRWAVRVQDVYQSLLDFNPSIVHFSGHGSGDDGLVLEDETGNVRLVETVALAKLFGLFANNIECVVLNACYSEVQASAIAQHIPYVIGMKQAIGDKAAIKFATGFYHALGTGESVEFAYKLGCTVIQLEGIPEHLTPDLKKKQSSF